MCTSTKIGPRVPIKRPGSAVSLQDCQLGREESREECPLRFGGMLEEGFPRVCRAAVSGPVRVAVCVCGGGGGSVDFYAPPLGVVSRFLFITGKLEQNAAVSQFLFGEISKAKAPKQTLYINGLTV
jgi:hypothetical protein